MKRKHQVIAVMMLATALAADRAAAAAAPVLRPQIVQTARRISDRLTRSFRQVVPANTLRQDRQVRQAPAEPDQPAIDQVHVHRMPMPAHRFRLPPPLA